MIGLEIAGLHSALAGPFDLRVAPGEAVAIAGPSGSGKSLFLRMIADLDPNEGRAALGGKDRRAMPAPAWRRLIPYVAAESGWWAERVDAHLAPATREAAVTLADRLGLKPDLAAGPVARLSTGEKQRWALVRALVLAAPALLLDEPTGPLDPVSVGRVEDVLRERLAAGLILLFATHDPAQPGRLGARLLRMQDGKAHEA